MPSGAVAGIKLLSPMFFSFWVSYAVRPDKQHHPNICRFAHISASLLFQPQADLSDASTMPISPSVNKYAAQPLRSRFVSVTIQAHRPKHPAGDPCAALAIDE